MSRAETELYGFDDSLPIEPIEAGSTVFVAGPALSRAEDLALSLVADGSAAGDGMLFVSTNQTSEKLLDNCARMRPGFEAGLAGIIDCSGQGLTPSKFDAEIKTISTQSDLTGIGMKFSALYEGLYMKADERVRTGLVSLSSLLMYVDLRSLYRFVQTISGRIDSASGLGVFAIDPTTHDTQTVNTLSQVADGRIEVREAENGDADGELRVRGLPNQPEGWQPFSLPE